ncbi:Alpha/Beta hydrolase protein [Rhodotorula toruloides]|uniref:acylaminoacyl-peptidase n=1 Tax=Rhodotorula toruloides (strain NP11) TaxID=1130832 RepID=M7WRX7_RHOT1|nr:acylaminoacyl-peptidase [Rhodotorula toruloides NP11]EMS23292.1 acylaminoacyl-peptidase [Rhodotorula toruloides NP11]
MTRHTHDTHATGDRIDHVLDLASELFHLPTPTAAHWTPAHAHGDDRVSQLHLTLSQRSLSSLSKRTLTQSVTLSPSLTVLASTPPTDRSDSIKHVAFSPDGKKQAVFRVTPAKEGKAEKRSIEVVSAESGRVECEVECKSEVHGDWYFDSTFGSVAWHPSFQALVYRPSKDKFVYTADWGETFTGKKSPRLFLLLLPNSPFSSLLSSSKPSIHRLTNEGNTSYGQPSFLPDSPEGLPRLVATGYDALPDGRKLGIVYCTNRLARVWVLELGVEEREGKEGEGEREKTFKVTKTLPVSPADRSSRSPRVVPSSTTDSAQIVYLSNILGSVHASCAQLHFASLSPSEDRVLVKQVDAPTPDDDFPGLYVDQLPSQPFVHVGEEEGWSVVAASSWRSRRVPLLISLTTGRVTSLAPWPAAHPESDAALPYLSVQQGELESFNVLGTDGVGRVVAVRSGCGTVGRVVVADLGGKGVEWKVVREAGVSDELAAALSRISYTVLPLPHFAPSELILVSPIPIDPTAESRPNLPPLIVYPHGGPHSTYTTDFSYAVAAHVLAGYRLVLVNYPGSTGFGQHTISALPARLGEWEVEATLASAHYLNALSLASRTKGKRLLMGGSHGGWIACHLSARWADEWDAVVMRNPVTDLVGNAGMTDIPDWCYEETSTPYSLSSPPTHLTSSTFNTFHSLSPLRHASNVTAPTLLLIGESDRRVPKDQGRAWFHALKGEGKAEVEMLVFPGNGHPVAETVEAEWVAFESGVRWLAKYTDFE